MRNQILEYLHPIFEELREERESQERLGYGATTHEIEYKPRDGFIPFTEGGLSLESFGDLGYMESTGATKHKAFQANIEKSYKEAEMQFIDNYPKAKGVPFDELSEELQEELYELEKDYLNEWTTLFSTRVQIYGPDNHRNDCKGEWAVYILSMFNDETPYHRDRYNTELFEESFVWNEENKPLIKQAILEAENEL